MKPKFTKGKWIVSDQREVAEMDYDYAILDEGGWYIAHIENCSDVEDEANAYLISAAPAMYNELHRQCLLCQLKDHECECELCNIGTILKQARGEV
jgi:hypothetical protein